MITITQTDNQTINISNRDIQDVLIKENENQNIKINNEISQDINLKQKENQTILINGGGITYSITDVLVNGVSVVTDNIAYIIVPTKTSELINDSGFINKENDPTVPNYVKAISLADINNWNNKQDELISGTTIKTINNESLLGSGNLSIEGTVYSAGTGININASNEISNTIVSYNDLEDLPTIPTKTSDLTNDSDYVTESELSDVAFSGSYADLSNIPVIPDSTSELINDSDFIDSTQLNTALSSKQDTLVSGTNIKTINSNSILGSGDLVISGGSATDVQINGTSIVSSNVANIITESAYNSSTNKIATKSDIPTQTSQLSNNSGFIDNTVNNLTNYYDKTSTDNLLNNKQDLLNVQTNTITLNTTYVSAGAIGSYQYGKIVVLTFDIYVRTSIPANTTFASNILKPNVNTHSILTSNNNSYDIIAKKTDNTLYCSGTMPSGYYNGQMVYIMND